MRRVMLADDSVAARKSIQAVLEMAGIEVVAVGSGELALARLDEIAPEMVLLDAVMPGRNGYEICAEIKNHPRYRDVPVLLVTSDFEPYDEEAAVEARADGHLTKPLDAKAIQIMKDAFAKYSPEAAGTLAPSHGDAVVPPPAPAFPDPSTFITGAMRVSDIDREVARREAAQGHSGSGSPVPDHVVDDSDVAPAVAVAPARAATTEDLDPEVAQHAEAELIAGSFGRDTNVATGTTVRPEQCPDCGTPTVPGDVFCIACGTPLIMTQAEVDAHAAAHPAGPLCPECGEDLSQGEVFCINCGAMVA